MAMLAKVQVLGCCATGQKVVTTVQKVVTTVQKVVTTVQKVVTAVQKVVTTVQKRLPNPQDGDCMILQNVRYCLHSTTSSGAVLYFNGNE